MVYIIPKKKKLNNYILIYNLLVKIVTATCSVHVLHFFSQDQMKTNIFFKV